MVRRLNFPEGWRILHGLLSIFTWKPVPSREAKAAKHNIVGRKEQKIWICGLRGPGRSWGFQGEADTVRLNPINEGLHLWGINFHLMRKPTQQAKQTIKNDG
jgi:hypothetical protein